MKSQIKTILLLILLQGISFNLAHPITPSFVNDLGISTIYFGVFFASMSLGAVFGSPFWGFIFDKGNIKTPFILGALMYAIGQLFFAFSNHEIFMIISRFISGFGASSSTIILSALVISNSNKNNVGRNLSFFAAFGIIGSSLGYYIGGFISNLIQFLPTDSYQFVFVFQSAFTILFLFITVIFLPRFQVSSNNSKNFFSEIKSLKDMPLYQWLFYLALLSVTMSFMFLSKYIDVSFASRGYSPNVIGNYVLITGILSVITSVLIVPKLMKFKSIFVISMLLIIASISVIITFTLSNFILALYSIYLLFVISKTAFQPFEQSYIATFGDQYGKLMGLRQFFVSIGMVLGPLLLGVLYDQNEVLSFYVSSVLLLIGLLFILIGHQSFIKKVLKSS
jgi:DHA1 family multidrug resistance protein-like MFS transporter